MYRPPLTIEEMQEIAKSRGGRCLSKTYHGSIVKLEWECAKKHTWWAAPGNVKPGSWCPECARVPKITIGDMDEIAEKRGGRCLSEEYQHSRTNLLWQCALGHKWQATPNKIKQDTWCPVCARKRRIRPTDIVTIFE